MATSYFSFISCISPLVIISLLYPKYSILFLALQAIDLLISYPLTSNPKSKASMTTVPTPQHGSIIFKLLSSQVAILTNALAILNGIAFEYEYGLSLCFCHLKSFFISSPNIHLSLNFVTASSTLGLCISGRPVTTNPIPLIALRRSS